MGLSDQKGLRMALSIREREVFTLIARGYTDKEAAVKLKLSIKTIQYHMHNVVLKLQARNRVNAALIYMRKNPKWKV